MPRIRTIFASLKTERVLLACLLGAVLGWFLKEPFTSLFFPGKTFAGRGPAIQIVLLVFLFLAFFSLLLFALPKLLDLLVAKAQVVLATLALIPLAAYALMGSFSRFVSDDFSSAALAARLGVWGAAVDWYMNWTGRFSANLVDSLTGYLGQQALAWQTGIVLVLWLAALTLVSRLLLPGDFGRLKQSAALFLSALTLTVTFQVTPDLPQSLYWAQGMHSLILPLALGTFLAALLLYRWQQPAPSGLFWWVLGAGLLAFAAGGFGETYVSLQTLLLTLALFLGVTLRPADFRKKLFWIVAVCLAASLAAMVIIILSPGNAARQANFPPTPSLPAMLWITLKAYFSYLGTTFVSLSKIWQLMALLLAAFVVGNGFLFRGNADIDAVSSEKTLRRLLLTLVFTIGLSYASFVPSAFGMSTTPPGRTLVIPTFLLAAGVALIGFIGGTGLRRQTRNLREEKDGVLRAAAWVLFLAFSANLFFTTRGILSFLPDYSRFARVSDQVEEIIRQAKAEGRDSVEIPEVHNHFGLSDFGQGTNQWLDDAVNKYYGMNVIVNKNLNKRFK